MHVQHGVIPSKTSSLALLDPHAHVVRKVILRGRHCSDADRRRFLDSHELLRLFDECRHAATDAQAVMLLAHRHGQWAHQRGFKLSLRTLYRIRRRLDPSSADDFDGNVGRQGRSKRAAGPCSPDAWDHFKALWLTPQRRKISLCWEVTKIEAARRGWAWPALRTIQKRVNDELPPFFADRFRLGPQAWARKHAPRIERDLSQIRPNHCWIGDHAQFDLLCTGEHTGGPASGRSSAKPIRPWLTAWQDQRSRMIVGWQITAGPDSETILAAFREAVLELGAPQQVIIDNGKDYRAKGFSGGRRGKPRLDEQRVLSVCGRLDIHVTFCEPFNPGSKAIESFFDTLHERFDKLFDSYCGANPDKRPEDLYRRLRARRVELPTLDQLRDRFATWLDAYHRRPHSGDGMDGRCPLDVFERCDPIPRRTAPRATLDLLLRKTVTVTVTRKGVRYDGVQYGQGNPKLLPLHGRRVLVRLDPERADAVAVCDLDGRHLTWARNQRLTGQTRDDIKIAKKRQKRARQLAASAAPALREARKTVVEHVIAAQCEHAAQLRQAAGGEVCSTGLQPAQRGLALLPAAAAVAPPPLFDEPADEPDADAPLDFGADALSAAAPTTGQLLGSLEFDDAS